jgi:nicotinamide phosphoribosyltransferase
MKLTPTLMADFYKLSHRVQYPEKTQVVYSTWTPRSGKHLPHVKRVVAFGFQGFLNELNETFQEGFFDVPKDQAIGEYSRIVKNCLGVQNPETKHLEELHDLGYLPLKVNAVREGTMVPFRVPMLTIENTDSRFFWLTNYVETLASTNLWKPCTAASVSTVYREILNKYANETTGSTMGVEFQGHDFSMRGMSGAEDAARTGVGHLLNFVGTDTIPAIQYAEQYYNANVEKELVGCSVNATEHSVMCAGGKEDEYETYRRLIEDTYPTGIVSIVSDTWDLWNVMENIIPSLKDSILARDGGEESLDKVVIRPDSGDPADILCGTLGKLKHFSKENCPTEKDFLEWAEDHMDDYLCVNTPHGEYGGDYTCEVVYDNKIYNLTYSPDWDRHDKQYYYIDNYGDKTPTINDVREVSASDKGVVELLWDTFGGTVSPQGYKVLNPAVGAIYGDAITVERCTDICERLKEKGFASTNVVFGIGSYTYQYLTRDSLGFAMKATSVTIDGEEKAIFKDPATDDGTKKSAKGRVQVKRLLNGELAVQDSETLLKSAVGEDLLEPIYENGKLLREQSLAEIRGMIAEQL